MKTVMDEAMRAAREWTMSESAIATVRMLMKMMELSAVVKMKMMDEFRHRFCSGRPRPEAARQVKSACSTCYHQRLRMRMKMMTTTMRVERSMVHQAEV
jgi:hypothetical protein